MTALGEIDLDLAVSDEFVLRSIPGAVDYLAEDLRRLDGASARVLRRERNALLVSYDGPLRALAAIRTFDACALPVDGDPENLLQKSRSDGVLRALTPLDGELRFRVGDIGDERWPLRRRLEGLAGWRNSVDAWDLNLESWGEQLVAEVGPLFLTRRFGELERMPASTNPLIAAVMVRLAKVEPGHLVLDPFCGAGTLLVLAGQMQQAGLVGCDLNRAWLALAGVNLSSRGVAGRLLNADAGRLPIASGSIDRVVSNIPFGKRIGSHRTNTELYPSALREIARVMHGQSRAVLLTDDKRLFKETVQRTPLIRVVKEIMLERGGLHPTAYVLSKRGR